MYVIRLFVVRCIDPWTDDRTGSSRAFRHLQIGRPTIVYFNLHIITVRIRRTVYYDRAGVLRQYVFRQFVVADSDACARL